MTPDQCVFYELGGIYEQNAIAIETVPVYNKLKPFHPKMKKWLGYIVKMDDIRYYVTGDMDVTEKIRKVQCDVAMIPIGGGYTMDKKQAVEYVAHIAPKAVIPTHYGGIVGEKTDGSEFEEHLKAMYKDVRVEFKP